MKNTLYILLAMLIALPALLIVAGQLGMLSGTAPSDLRVQDGRLKAPSTTRNSVSSQAGLHPDSPMLRYADIAALPADGADAQVAMGRLLKVLQAMPGVRITVQDADYVRAEATTTVLGFVDDLEFWFNPANNAIDLRSASRLGREDFGVNRKRIEHVRAAYANRS